MAAPHARLRKALSAPGLLGLIRTRFAAIPEHRSGTCRFSLPDTLMSGLAMFGLKFPSLLRFDEGRNEEAIRHNLRTLYGVEQAPCDTQLRTILDPVDPPALQSAFVAIHRRLQRHKGLEDYVYWQGHYLVSIDGTGQFASANVRCADCCVKHTRAGERYYHQLLAAVLVHPQRKTVLPFAPEAITRQDGASKNDCERNAAKRLLGRLRQAHPHQKLIVVEDSLASNGPHLELLQQLDLRFIIGVKEGDHQALFAAVREKLCAGACQEYEYTDAEGITHGFRFVNDLPLNKAHPQVRVNVLDYWEIRNGRERPFTWVTDLALTRESVEPIMRGGRARWKVENETFNTLKTQGYDLEHNYGHGKRHLSTVLAYLMLLAFLVDQTQEHACRLFQAARGAYRSRVALWERLRGLFENFYLPDWATVWWVIAHRREHAPQETLVPAIRFDTS